MATSHWQVPAPAQYRQHDQQGHDEEEEEEEEESFGEEFSESEQRTARQPLQVSYEELSNTICRLTRNIRGPLTIRKLYWLEPCLVDYYGNQLGYGVRSLLQLLVQNPELQQLIRNYDDVMLGSGGQPDWQEGRHTDWEQRQQQQRQQQQPQQQPAAVQRRGPHVHGGSWGQANSAAQQQVLGGASEFTRESEVPERAELQAAAQRTRPASSGPPVERVLMQLNLMDIVRPHFEDLQQEYDAEQREEQQQQQQQRRRRNMAQRHDETWRRQGQQQPAEQWLHLPSSRFAEAKAATSDRLGWEYTQSKAAEAAAAAAVAAARGAVGSTRRVPVSHLEMAARCRVFIAAAREVFLGCLQSSSLNDVLNNRVGVPVILAAAAGSAAAIAAEAGPNYTAELHVKYLAHILKLKPRRQAFTHVLQWTFDTRDWQNADAVQQAIKEQNLLLFDVTPLAALVMWETQPDTQRDPNVATGRWGEQLVALLLKLWYGDEADVIWKNGSEESKEPFDIFVSHKNWNVNCNYQAEELVEVKTTQSRSGRKFYFSREEMNAARSRQKGYCVVRVWGCPPVHSPGRPSTAAAGAALTSVADPTLDNTMMVFNETVVVLVIRDPCRLHDQQVVRFTSVRPEQQGYEQSGVYELEV